MAQLGSLLFVAPAILIAIICHECAHLDGQLYVELVEGELEDVEDMGEDEE